VQSPDDQRILAAQTPEGPARTLFSQAVPGGKALLRLLNFLQTRGLERHAAAAVDGAVPENLRAAFNARVEQIVSPAARSVTDGSIATTSEAADLENIARELIAAAQVTTLTGVGPSWRSMGPATIRNGQTYNTAIRMNVSGRVAAIAVDPHNPAHVLCGAANGGVWESFNRGGSWAPRTDFAATTAVGALTFSPANPSIVYCGTGEGNWWSWLGVGILRSNNGGASWSTLCTAPFVGKGFFDLRVDPANGNHLIAATTGGLYVSTDGGVTWTQPRSVQTWSIAFGAGEVLAASSDGIARSTDGGATWRAVPLPGSPGGFTRIAVSIAPSNPAVAYAWGASGSNGYLWRRAGGTWTPASSLPPGLDLSQAWYDWYAAAAPDRDNQVYLGAIEAYRGDFSGAVWNWTVLSNHSGGAFHPDQHAVTFEPGNPNTIYAGSDGGLFHSPDRGNTWVHCNNGLVISEFEYIAQNVGISRWLIGGTQDNGTDRWTGSSSFDHVADGDGGYVAVNHDDPRTVFRTFYGMSPEVSSSNGDWNTWTSVAPPTPQGEGSAFYPPMRCSDSNGATLAIAGGALYVSRANGASWVRLAFPGAASASAICVPNANKRLCWCKRRPPFPHQLEWSCMDTACRPDNTTGRRER